MTIKDIKQALVIIACVVVFMVGLSNIHVANNASDKVLVRIKIDKNDFFSALLTLS